MRLTKIKPESAEWKRLLGMGAGDFLGHKAATEFWAICTPDPIGVLGFEKISEEVCECELWVREDKRGGWWTRSFYSMLLGIGFSQAKVIVAAVKEGEASHRMVEKLGWNKYCQQDGLSYYCIARKDCMSVQPD